MTSSRPQRRRLLGSLLASTVLVVASCAMPTWTPKASPSSIPGLGASVDPAAAGKAVVGLVTDYGQCDEAEGKIAAMVEGWQPDIVVTTGDNTQGVDGCVPFTESVGSYYGDFIKDRRGPRFFPSTGNHDYEDVGEPAPGGKSTEYTAYFDYLPTNADPSRRWYSVQVGPVVFFMVDSESPDNDLAKQRTWLRDSLASAPRDVWKVVLFHRPPFTSGPHDPYTPMSPSSGWTYKEWGADIVLNGHQHVFEDVIHDGLHFVTTGVGGKHLQRECPKTRAEGSQLCLEGAGALLIHGSANELSLEYRLVDTPETKSWELTLTR